MVDCSTQIESNFYGNVGGKNQTSSPHTNKSVSKVAHCTCQGEVAFMDQQVSGVHSFSEKKRRVNRKSQPDICLTWICLWIKDHATAFLILQISALSQLYRDLSGGHCLKTGEQSRKAAAVWREVWDERTFQLFRSAYTQDRHDVAKN